MPCALKTHGGRRPRAGGLWRRERVSRERHDRARFTGGGPLGDSP